MDNIKRAQLGVGAIRAATSPTNAWRADTAQAAVKDVLACIAHVCDLLGLEPRLTFEQALRVYDGDLEDGPKVRQFIDGAGQSFASAQVWGE